MEPLSDLPTTETWQQIIRKISSKLGADTRGWFGDIECESLPDGSVRLTVANTIQQYFIESNYSDLLREAVEKAFGANVPFRFEVKNRPAPHADMAAEGPRTVRAREERITEKRPTLQDRLGRAGLTERLSFENYAIATSNRHSALAAQAVAKHPGSLYNPFYLHGPTSTGKTHLVQAIGQEILTRNPSAVVRYMTAEAFTNEFLEALHDGTISSFRNRYRKVDALIIDDVQFFENKNSTLEEFFHTFNHIIHARKQIIISSELPPGTIDLGDRIRSRFEAGLSAHLTNPDLETRLAILRMKNAEIGDPVSDPILQLLASRIHSNVRRLEGALIKLASYQSLGGTRLTPENVSDFLSETFAQESSSNITIARIQKVVAEFFDVRLQDILGKKRVKEIATARHAAMALSRELTKSTLSQIGSAFGDRDHTTVMHAVRQVAHRRETEPAFDREMEALAEQCRKPGV